MRILKRGGLPNGPSVVLVVIVAFSIIFGIGALITQQVASLAQELPRYQVTLKEKVSALKDATAGSGGAIKQAGETLKALQEQLEAPPTNNPTSVTITPLPNLGGGSRSGPIPVEVHTPAPTPLDQLQSIIGVVLEPLATIGAVLLFVLFLLLQREDVRDRAIRLLGAYDLEKIDDRDGRRGRSVEPLLPGHDGHQCRLRHHRRRGPVDYRRAQPRALGRARHAHALRAVYRLLHRGSLPTNARGGR